MSTTITGTKEGATFEDATTPATGTLALSTGNVAGKTFTAQSNTPGLYGTFSIDAAGVWTYNVDNSFSGVQALTASQVVTDSFLVDYDGLVFASIKVQVNGKNDIALISGMLSQTLSSGQSSVSGTLKIEDPDTGENRFVPVTRKDGNWGYFSITADGATQYTLTNTAGSATDRVETFAVTSLDGSGSNVKVTLLAATAGGTPLNGTENNDTLTSTAAAETINGLGGIDKVVYPGAYAGYKLTASATGYTVDGSSAGQGNDALSNIERLQFSDKKLALDVTPGGRAGQAAEFIGMLAYPMLKNPAIVGTILGYFDSGAPMASLCQTAIDAGLINSLAGSASDLDLARLVYRNVVGSEADTAVAQSLAGYLKTSGGSYSRADFLATVSTLELNQQHVNLVGLQQTGLEYL